MADTAVENAIAMRDGMAAKIAAAESQIKEFRANMARAEKFISDWEDFSGQKAPTTHVVTEQPARSATAVAKANNPKKEHVASVAREILSQRRWRKPVMCVVLACVGSRLKCDTDSPKGIGCWHGKTLQAPEQGLSPWLRSPNMWWDGFATDRTFLYCSDMPARWKSNRPMSRQQFEARFPKTPEGREWVAEAQRQRWARSRAATACEEGERILI